MSKKFKNKTWDWAAYGAHLVGHEGFYTSIFELITNSIDAVRDSEVKRIDITYDPRIMFKVEDSGCGMSENELAHAMRYFDSKKQGPNNQFGTGIKTAFSFLDSRVGGSYSIYTRTINGAYKTESPYGDKIVVEPVTQFPAEDWVSTVIRTGISCQCPTTEEIKDKIRFFCTDAIRNGIVIRFNGEVLTSVVPGRVNCSEDDIPFKIESGSKAISYVTYDIDENTEWKPAADTQGVYVFYNKRFICHEGLMLIPGPNGKFPRKTKLHNHYNGLVTFVFIEDETKKGKLPLTACKNAVDWDSNTGSSYREVIGNIIKTPYITLKKNNEAESKALVELFLKKYLNGCAYFSECSIDSSKKLRADGVIIETSSIHDAKLLNKLAKDSVVLDDEIVKYESKNANGELEVHKCVKSLIEFKGAKREITGKEVGQLIGYIVAFRDAYGYIPDNNMLIGAKISDEANTLIKELAPLYNISFETLI